MKVLLLVFLQLICIGLGSEHEHVAKPHLVIGSEPMAHPDDNTGHAVRSGTLQYLNPAQLKAIYGMTGSGTGAGKTIAIIDAYGASTAEADLGVFSSTNNLPAATTANGMFKKVNQTGGSTYPPDDTTGNWGLETGLDLQAAHGFAPGAKLLLIVCSSTSSNDLFAGLNYAKSVGANYISMSFGFPEGSYNSYFDSTYFSGTTTSSFFASTGDSGSAGGIEYPSASPYVVAVGGTSVYTDSNHNYVSESGWSGSGGGCSAYSTAISAQSSFAGYSSLGCSGKKSLPDIAMDANPYSGLLIYVSQSSSAYASCTAPNCWRIVGGTSLASPLAAGRAAVRGVQITPSYVYTGSITFRDITTGNNTAYSCTPGLDKVTGRGTWVGQT